MTSSAKLTTLRVYAVVQHTGVTTLKVRTTATTNSQGIAGKYTSPGKETDAAVAVAWGIAHF